MKESIIIDTNGFYIEPELVPIDTYGVAPIYEQPTPAEPDEDEDQKPSKPILVGYRVAVPVPQGLFKPRFDLEGWEVYSTSQDDQRVHTDQPIPLPRPDVQFWTEGLTQVEIEALRNIPQPETDAQKIARLEQDKAALEQRLQAAEGAILFLLDND